MKIWDIWRKFFPQRTYAQTVGARGEELASAELGRLGYTVLERNFRGCGGEIDIIAMDGEELVFVEVKTRTNARFGNPEEAVDAHKTACISRAAMAYWRQKRLRGRIVRCDIVAVFFSGDAATEITVFKNAVQLSGNFF